MFPELGGLLEQRPQKKLRPSKGKGESKNDCAGGRPSKVETPEDKDLDLSGLQANLCGRSLGAMAGNRRLVFVVVVLGDGGRLLLTFFCHFHTEAVPIARAMPACTFNDKLFFRRSRF